MTTLESPPRSSKTTTLSPQSEAPATWIVSRASADIRWRAEMPAEELGAKLILVEDKDTKSYTDPDYDGPFRWELTDEGAFYPDIEGTVVWTRPCMARAVHGAAMALQGHRVICEVDDNYLSPSQQNIFMRLNDYTPEKRRSHMQAFASMDAIVCSTEELERTYQRAFRKELGVKPTTYVARNHINPKDWVGRRPMITTPKTRLRVGWAGSHQHIWDLRLAAPALHLAKQLGAEIVLIGLDPATSDPEWRTFLGDYTHIPWCDPEDYHSLYLNLDIGIAPLVMNQHTLGKSDIKGLEYTMGGAACVLQNNAVYNKTWKHGETALLAGSPDEMALYVADLLRNTRQREELVSAAKQYVLEERTIQGNIHEWKAAIEGA